LKEGVPCSPTPQQQKKNEDCNVRTGEGGGRPQASHKRTEGGRLRGDEGTKGGGGGGTPETMGVKHHKKNLEMGRNYPPDLESPKKIGRKRTECPFINQTIDVDDTPKLESWRKKKNGGGKQPVMSFQQLKRRRRNDGKIGLGKIAT